MRKEVFDRLNNIYYFPDIRFDKNSNEDNLYNLLDNLFKTFNYEYKDIKRFLLDTLNEGRKLSLKEILKETELDSADEINLLPGDKLLELEKSQILLIE